MLERADFYILETAKSQDKLPFVCRLVHKIYRMGQHCYLYCEQSLQTELDNLLWTFRQDSFIPHQIHRPDQVDDHTPVLIGPCPVAANSDHVLVILSAAPPPKDSLPPFARLVDLVCKGDSTDQQAARLRYRWYLDHNISIANHSIH